MIESVPPPPWRRTPGKPRQQLSLDAIVGAALGVLEAEGLDGVSMRRVAQELNTGPASLYAHVRNKQELHELMLDAAMRVIEVPEPDPARWRRQLMDVCLEQARIMLDKPGIARIAMRTLIPTTPGLIIAMDGLLGILRCSGIPENRIPAAADALALHVTAYAYEASLWQEEGSSEARERIEQIGEYLTSLPASVVPNLHLMHLDPGTGADHFEFALDVFIAGLAAYASGDFPAGTA